MTHTLSLLVGTLTATSLFAQPGPAFEVASIRPYVIAPATPPKREIIGNRIHFALSPGDLIEYAFELKDYQLQGVPSWTSETIFEISAKAQGDDALTPARIRPMLQSLLVDRFQLKFHREIRETKVYALVPGKDSKKIKLSEPGAKRPVTTMTETSIIWPFTNSSMKFLADLLSDFADRPVLDKTGLTGLYDYQVVFTGNVELGGSVFGPSLSTAVEEQFGLKLESRKAPIEVLVIDRLEKPSEN